MDKPAEAGCSDPSGFGELKVLDKPASYPIV